MRRMILPLLLCASAAANAGGLNDAADFYKNKGSTELYYYLHGAFAGYGVVNAQADVHGEPKLYCQPGKLAQTSMDLVALVEGELPIAQKLYKRGLSNLPIEFVLLDALQRSFPCEN